MEEADPNQLRDAEILRLVAMAKLAYRNAMSRKLKIKTREAWHGKYTNAVLALNQLLKDAQIKEYELRLRAIEENEKEDH